MSNGQGPQMLSIIARTCVDNRVEKSLVALYTFVQTVQVYAVMPATACTAQSIYNSSVFNFYFHLSLQLLVETSANYIVVQIIDWSNEMLFRLFQVNPMLEDGRNQSLSPQVLRYDH